MCNPPSLGSEYAITMKKGGSGNYIIAILFPIVCLFSSFSFFRNVNEWQIQGKWIGFVISFFIAAMLLFIIRFSNPCRNWSYGLTARICAISAISTNIAVAVICILQMADIIPAVSPFPATSDFDNPAGVAALMCATFPFSTVTDEGRMNTNVFRVFAVFALDILLHITATGSHTDDSDCFYISSQNSIIGEPRYEFEYIIWAGSIGGLERGFSLHNLGDYQFHERWMQGELGEGHYRLVQGPASRLPKYTSVNKHNGSVIEW